jgi:hypothetical protein
MEYVFLFVVTVVGAILWSIYQSKGLKKASNKIENESILPALDYLYKSPNTKEKHYQFTQSLKELDKYIIQYKDACYIPSEDVFVRLFKHTDNHHADILGHDRFVLIISRMKTANSELLFKTLIQQITKFPKSSLAHQRLAICVEKGHLLPPALLDSFISYLDENPTDSIRQSIFLQGINKIMFLSSSSERRQGIYNKALQILEENPNIKSVRKFVLEIGRWHFGKSRSDGKVSIYDEQMIQNDILVRVSQ